MTVPGSRLVTPDFIARNTVPAQPPLVPELRLYLATEATALWEVTEAELDERGLPPPFWAFPWAGGQALARFLIDNAELAAGRRVLDLGAGSGIAGLAAAWVSAATVIANDTDAVAGTAMAMNAELNGLSDRFTVEIRDMLDEPVLAADGGALFDLVLAADVLYETSMSKRVLAWLQRHANAGALVLIGDPGRNAHKDDVYDLCARYDVPVPRDLEDREVRRTSVWRLPPGHGS